MVDRDGLENRCACKRTVGSNPTPSAITARDNCLRGPARLLKGPVFAAFPEQAPHSAHRTNGYFRLSSAVSLQTSRLDEFSADFQVIDLAE